MQTEISVVDRGHSRIRSRRYFRSERLTPRDKGRVRSAVQNAERAILGIMVIMVDDELQSLLRDRFFRSTGIGQLAPKSISSRPDPFPLTVEGGRWASQGVFPLYLTINPETILQQTPLLTLALQILDIDDAKFAVSVR